MSEANGVTRMLSRTSLVLGIAAAVIYPTVTASIQWGEMRHELQANTAAVKDVAIGLEKVAQVTSNNVSEITALQGEIAFAAATNDGLTKENRALREAVQKTGKTTAALKEAVTDNTRATDWHSYRLRQLTDETEKKR